MIIDKWLRYEYTNNLNGFIRNDDYSKSKQDVALSFLYTDIMYHPPALLRFSSMLWKTLMYFCILLVLGPLNL